MKLRDRKYPLKEVPDALVNAVEITALLEQPCPRGGNRFLHLRIRSSAHAGTALARECWERHRFQIMEERQFLPGTRPKAWWAFDAPPGRPLRWEVDPAFPWYDQSARATQKAQAQWLHSRNLLTPAERRTLPAEWFAPTRPKLEIIP